MTVVDWVAVALIILIAVAILMAPAVIGVLRAVDWWDDRVVRRIKRDLRSEHPPVPP